MKKIIFYIIFLLSLTTDIFGQNEKSRLKILNIHVGLNFSNLIGSEAPYKINIYGSDIHYGVIDGQDITKAIGYYDYQTNIIKDARIDLKLGIGFEYFLNKNLSVYSSLNYEGKGINIKSHEEYSYLHGIEEPPPNTIGPPKPDSDYAIYNEVFDLNIKNNYLTLPILLRKYFSNQKFYIQGGFYTGYLLKSKINTRLKKHNYIPDYNFYGFSYTFGFDKVDTKKEFTTNIDFGTSLGAGFNYPLNNKLFLKADYIINIGFLKIDKKYNNEFELLKDRILTTGSSTTPIRSTNYYGLNSQARNINMSFTIGIGFKI